MEAKYTQGQWFYTTEGKNALGLVEQDGTNIMHMATLDNSTAASCMEANARRIVACVNACEGIPTEALECQSKRKISESWVKQRDAMLDALRMAESFIAKLEDDDDYTDGQVETINAIRSAITKAKCSEISA